MRIAERHHTFINCDLMTVENKCKSKPSSVKEGCFDEELMIWEKQFQEYQNVSGQMMDDSMQVAALIERAPLSVRPEEIPVPDDGEEEPVPEEEKEDQGQ
eukprot:3490433-Heterocapsa_arctica.AAC.1